LKRSRATTAPLITKPLFEAGVQCSKRLHLDYHAKRTPARSPRQEELVALGERLVDLASQAFPRGTDLKGVAKEDAISRTRDEIASGRPGALFHAVFQGGGVEVVCDIALVVGPNEVDLFEVKAGTFLKPRHLTDVALQVHAVEACGVQVKSASILHLEERYVHDGSRDYPVHKLFRSEDVTSRARNQLARVAEQVGSFQSVVDDEGMLELPTGTWCRNPLPCPHLERCRAEGPEHPLFELPHLAAVVESKLHEEAIESIDQLKISQNGLSSGQRRAVRAIQEDKLIVEPFVRDELGDVDYPLCFVHVLWHLDPLPRFAQSRPWQKLPYAWSAHRFEQSGRSYHRSFVSATQDDPRDATIKSLAEEIRDAGTVVVYDRGWDERFRALLEDMPERKTDLRALLGAPLLELGHLIYHGVYHPDFHGMFDLERVRGILGAQLPAPSGEPIEGLDALDDDLTDEDAAADAYQKILAKRTRSTTRDKLSEQLTAYVRHRSAALVAVRRLLLG
ncbi:MAG: DUF2779 domain-containing protein, partial [Planctomycetota bacterium]|nr:DUF2779 domain-containing protein [Planctomycetota bacterium]